MKITIVFAFVFCGIEAVSGQPAIRDSLWRKFANEKDEIAKVKILLQLCDIFSNDISGDTAFTIAQQSLKLSKSIGYKRGEMRSKDALAAALWMQGDFAKCIQFAYSVLPYAESETDDRFLFLVRSKLAMAYRDQADYLEALDWMRKNYKIMASIDDCSYCAAVTGFFGSCYFGMEKFDSALYYLNKALAYPPGWGFGWISLMMGRTQEKLNNTDLAFKFYRQSIDDLSQLSNSKDLAGAYSSMAGLFQKMGETDSAIHYGKKALAFAREKRFNAEIADAYMILSSAYEKSNTTEALSYYKLAIKARDNLFNFEKQRQVTSSKFTEELRQSELRSAELQYKNRIRTYILIGITGFFLVIMIILFRNNQQKQKAKAKIENAYTELKATQQQLIQSEKMASLGELTAGIAHEIQNPLNFVNNFSEVNAELVDELQSELATGNWQSAKEIASNIKENEAKINHHGKRADAIVKGMLQHSRISSGQKEPTDINALADEYLRLAYHGLRAKDKSFNAKFETDLDNTIGKINVVPQDIGRVLLNLINNAFYAVNEKKQRLDGTYEPTVSVSTRKLKDKVEVKVKDNGNGIPGKVLDKIFQPFFTTKPTGIGTGLGLSLSYDIVRAHGGELKVETKEGEGATFYVQLPY